MFPCAPSVPLVGAEEVLEIPSRRQTSGHPSLPLRGPSSNRRFGENPDKRTFLRCYRQTSRGSTVCCYSLEQSASQSSSRTDGRRPSRVRSNGAALAGCPERK